MNTIIGIESWQPICAPALALVNARGLIRATKQTPGVPVSLPVRFRHHGRAAFLARRHDLDFRHVDKGVQNGEVALAGNAEGALDAVDAQLVDQDLAAGSKVVCSHVIGGGRHGAVHGGSGDDRRPPLAPFAGAAKASVRPGRRCPILPDRPKPHR